MILTCGVVAGALMWAITPVSINTEREVQSFDAMATLLVTVDAPLDRLREPVQEDPEGPALPTPSPTPTLTESDQFLGLNRVALLVVTGEIPHRAAQDLGYAGDPAVLAESVRVNPDWPSRSVVIYMNAKDSQTPVDTVNAFAYATVAYFDGPGRDTGIAVTLIEEATALPNEGTDAFVAPPSRLNRTLLAAVVG
ncbi:MAG: hypothetical protein Q4F67_13030, partial [Propionibacteriaceae bacterium]|nr:hypothetical protein [Propionibacteriaceae bacterium]